MSGELKEITTPFTAVVSRFWKADKNARDYKEAFHVVTVGAINYFPDSSTAHIRQHKNMECGWGDSSLARLEGEFHEIITHIAEAQEKGNLIDLRKFARRPG